MRKFIRHLLFWLGIGVIILMVFHLIWVPKALFETIFTPKTAYQTFEEGRYLSWNWTPDGKIIYVKDITMMSHVKSAGKMGYTQEGAKTVIAIIDKDGTNNRIIKEIEYLPPMEKRNRWYKDIEEEKRAKKKGIWRILSPVYFPPEPDRATLDKLYPDSPLSHIGWIDWNKVNNNLVFVANDKDGKLGIAVSNPDFKELKWIYYMKGPYFMYAHPQWSYDGKKIAFIDEGLWLTDLVTGQKEKIFKDPDIRYFSWHPNGDRIIVEAGPGKCGFIDLEGQYIDKWEKLQNIGDPSISPNGQWIVYFSVDTHIMDINGNNKRTLYPKGGSFFPKWSPDGKTILMGWEYQIEVINPDGYGYFEVTKGLQSK